jgi:hypothetical protein
MDYRHQVFQWPGSIAVGVTSLILSLSSGPGLAADEQAVPLPPEPAPITITVERVELPPVAEPVPVTVTVERVELPPVAEPVPITVTVERIRPPEPPEPVVLTLSVHRAEMLPPPEPVAVTVSLRRGEPSFPVAWSWRAVCPSGKYKGAYEGGWTLSTPDASGRFTGAFSGAGHVGSIEGQVSRSSIRFVRRFGRGATIEQVWAGTLGKSVGAGGETIERIEGTLTDPEGSCKFTATAGSSLSSQ